MGAEGEEQAMPDASKPPFMESLTAKEILGKHQSPGTQRQHHDRDTAEGVW